MAALDKIGCSTFLIQSFVHWPARTRSVFEREIFTEERLAIPTRACNRRARSRKSETCWRSFFVFVQLFASSPFGVGSWQQRPWTRRRWLNSLSRNEKMRKSLVSLDSRCPVSSFQFPSCLSSPSTGHLSRKNTGTRRQLGPKKYRESRALAHSPPLPPFTPFTALSLTFPDFSNPAGRERRATFRRAWNYCESTYRNNSSSNNYTLPLPSENCCNVFRGLWGWLLHGRTILNSAGLFKVSAYSLNLNQSKWYRFNNLLKLCHLSQIAEMSKICQNCGKSEWISNFWDLVILTIVRNTGNDEIFLLWHQSRISSHCNVSSKVFLNSKCSLKEISNSWCDK